MTEAFCKKGMHILQQAVHKDNGRAFDIAHTLYVDGIEYLETAMKHEYDDVAKAEMSSTIATYQMRCEYLAKSMNEKQCKWDDIQSIQEFENGQFIKMLPITVSSTARVQCDFDQYDCDDEHDEEYTYEISIMDEEDLEAESQDEDQEEEASKKEHTVTVIQPRISNQTTDCDDAMVRVSVDLDDQVQDSILIKQSLCGCNCFGLF